MNVAIVGGGFTGLSAAYELVKQGHRVTVFEKEKTLGGLAHGFKKKNWAWHLESAYHHLFTNDHAILDLMRELGLENQLILTRPITANLLLMTNQARRGEFFRSIVTALAKKLGWRDSGADIDECESKNEPRKALTDAQILPFDSPLHLLTYPGLSFVDKLRTGVLMALAKLYPAPFQWCGVNPFWQPLEWISAKKLFTVIGGTTAWQLLWDPLMIGKFGDYADRVSASWIWARIKKRTQKLYYIHGGFHTLVSSLEQAIKKRGGIIYTVATVKAIQTEIISHPREGGDPAFILNWILGSNQRMTQTQMFHRVLLTTPTPIAKKMVPHLTFDIGNLSLKIPHLHAQTLILETKEPILQGSTLQGRKVLPCEANGVYWLNIMDRSFPFLAVVAHTNMVDKKHYGGGHLTYFGNYLPSGHPYLSMTKQQLLKIFLPYIQRLNPSFSPHRPILCSSHLFTAPFAQPVHELHYSHRAPKLITPIPGIFLANMDSIYPWDRGTNYAVELGQKAAHAIGHSRDHNVVIPA